jgi:hypothetical protein
MRKAAFLLLWFYVFTIPWEHGTDFGAAIGSISRVAGAMAMIVGLIAVATSGSIRRIMIFHATVATFLLLVVASYFWTIDAEGSGVAIRAFPQQIWVVFLVWEFGSEVADRGPLMFAYVSGGYIAAFLTIQDYATTAILTHRDMRFTPEGWNPNELAISMALGIPMAAMLVCRPQRLLVRGVALGYLVLGPLTAALTGSRGGLVAMTISLVSVPVILGRKSPLRRVAALGLLVVIGMVALVYTPANSWNRLGTTASEFSSGNLNDRLPIWETGLRTFEESPENMLIGVGADGFLPAVGLGFVAHNTYLSILVDYGLIGFVLFFCLLFQVAAAALKATESERLALIFCFACWIVAVAGGTWEHSRTTWLVFGLIAASGLRPEATPALHSGDGPQVVSRLHQNYLSTNTAS